MTNNEIVAALEPYIEELQRAQRGFFLRVNDKQEIEVLEKVTGMRVMPNCPACFIRVIRAAVNAYNNAKANLQKDEQTAEQTEVTEVRDVTEIKESDNGEKSNKRAGKGNARKKKSVS